MSTLPQRNTIMPRKGVQHDSLENLVTSGLGYCCKYFFIKQFVDTPTTLIATRLGCSPRTINMHKREYRLGNLICNACTNCLERRINEKSTPVG